MKIIFNIFILFLSFLPLSVKANSLGAPKISEMILFADFVVEVTVLKKIKHEKLKKICQANYVIKSSYNFKGRKINKQVIRSDSPLALGKKYLLFIRQDGGELFLEQVLSESSDDIKNLIQTEFGKCSLGAKGYFSYYAWQVKNGKLLIPGPSAPPDIPKQFVKISLHTSGMSTVEYTKKFKREILSQN